MTKNISKVNQKKLLIINTGTVKKRFILQRLKKIGMQIIMVHAEKNWATPYVDEWILVNTQDHFLVLKKVQEYLKDHQVDGVVTFWEDDIILTSKIVEQFKFVGIPYKIAKIARNKFSFRKFCQENNISTPKFKLVDSPQDIKVIEKTFDFPVVIKPTYGSSSAYVIKADNSKELKEIYQFLKSNLSIQVESALKDGLQLLVEEYIDGDEVDIDILLQNGKIKFWSISDNFQTTEPFFVERGQAIPTILPESNQLELVAVAEEVLEKMGVQNGCIHFEAKYSSKGPVPIEVNLRMGGDEVYSFVKHAWKVDLIEHAAMIACDQFFSKIVKPAEPYNYLEGQYFLPQKSGVISSLNFPEKFTKLDKVCDFHFFRKVGDTVFTPPDEYEYLGWITAEGENSNDARDNLEKAVKQVSFEVVSFSPVSAVGKTERQSPFQPATFQKNLLKAQSKINKLRKIELKQLRQLHIGIACNTYTASEGSIEAELSSVGKNIENTLNKIGYQTTFIDFNDLSQAIKILQDGKIDLIFNVGERLNNSSLLEPHIASLFDAFQIPYTGSNPFTLGLCIDKIRVKKLLSYHNIPTAKWDYVYSLQEEVNSDLKYPLIVKPANTDNSIGIDNNSVVTNPSELKRQLEYVINQLKRPALIEEYLEGDEYDVSIMGSEQEDLTVLPLSRTNFQKLPNGYWHICPFEYKFEEAEIYKKHIKVERPPKKVNKKLLSLITEIAIDTYNILDCHDYGRVEIKLDKDNNPYILELNPNPSINLGDCLPEVGKLSGLDYGQFLEKIIYSAIQRYKNNPPFYHLQANLI